VHNVHSIRIINIIMMANINADHHLVSQATSASTLPSPIIPEQFSPAIRELLAVTRCPPACHTSLALVLIPAADCLSVVLAPFSKVVAVADFSLQYLAHAER
jgi:hypothetical protein